MKPKELLTSLLILSGLILLCCEAETIALQLALGLAGFALWGLAWVAWQAFARAECRRRMKIAQLREERKSA